MRHGVAPWAPSLYPPGRTLLTCSLWIFHETHLSTFRYPSQAHPRFPSSHENPFGPCRSERPSRQGPQAPGRLIAADGFGRDLRTPSVNAGDASQDAIARPDALAASTRGRYRFPPEARLHRPSEFAAALKGRRLARGAFFVLTSAAAAPAQDTARLGLIIAKRFAPHASTRNAIKRAIRESFRMTRHTLPVADYVVRLNARVPEGSLTHIKRTTRDEADGHFRRVKR